MKSLSGKWSATSARPSVRGRSRERNERLTSILLGAACFLGGFVAPALGQLPSIFSPTTNCSDPSQSGSQACQASQQTASPQGVYPTGSAPQDRTIDAQDSARGIGRDIYTDSAGFPLDRNSVDRNRILQRQFPIEPPTDFQRLVKESTNETLSIFGRELFRLPPSTFAPVDQVPVTPDYVLGPGDEVVVRIWGHNNFNGRLTVDRAGAIYVPQVGAIHVAGLRYSELQKQIQQDLTRSFRNFELSVNLGQLRSIPIFLLGEAQHPGSYTVSSLSTAFNALLSSGGPTAQGSLRNIQVQRGGATVATLDLYDIALRGDKSKDVPLQAGDVIFIPIVGAQVAITGSVRRPAIYEITGETTAGDLLTLAGGLSSTASAGRFSLERIETHRDRRAMSVNLDAAGRSMKLADGDVLHVDSVLATYKDSVTIRGNLANAGRFPWTPGLKLSTIIPDRESLQSNDYWKRRNRLGIPTPLFQPIESVSYGTRPWNGVRESNPSQADRGTYPAARRAASPTDDSITAPNYLENNSRIDPATAGVATAASGNRSTVEAEAALRNGLGTDRRDDTLGEASQQLERGSLADQQSAAQRNTADGAPRNEIRVPSPEIDWSYAVIERINPDTLQSSLVPFNLGRLVLNHDEKEDHILQPGDIVTILSQADVQVSQDEQTKYIRLEGEFGSSGVYSVKPDETLADVVRRAGGFTGKAYLFGATFSRESARVQQQQRLDEYVSSLSIQIQRASAVRAASTTNPALASGNIEGERALIQQLRAMRATGRVVLEFKPDSAGVDSVPAIPLENGDRFRIPSRPMVVSVVGSVYGQNVFLYNSARRVRDYLKLAGKPNRNADYRHSFIIRADGSIYSKETSGGLWSDHFESTSINPGDTIVVPEKPVRPSVLRDVIDWSQVFSSFAIGAAAINVIR